MLKTFVDWLRAGRSVALATTVETWGSAPRPVGTWMAIRGDGCLVGSVSGGCIEDDLVDRIKAGWPTEMRPQLVSYGVSREEAARFGLQCGGSVRLVVEPKPEIEVLAALLERITVKRITARVLDM